MDESQYQAAKQAYDAGDFRAAAKGFLAAAGRGVDGNGAAYHMAGNALMRLRRYGDASTVYGQALRDELYDKHGPVRVNLAQARVAQGEYAEAVEHFRAALDDPGYDQHYKALQGMASALVEMGRYEEAASAYRQAALDSGNPDPGKALNNLGLCFMALSRPGDAVEAYKAALGFDTYSGRGKALSNLGMALNATGAHGEAIKAFEKATQLHGHSLSPSAIAAFEASREAIAPRRETVEGWQTGELPPVDVHAIAGGVQAAVTPFPDAATGEGAGDPSSTGELFAGMGDDSAFFTMTEAEMKERDRVERRAERQARRGARAPWQLPLTIVVAVALVMSLLAALFFAGYGFPTQAMTTEGLLEARALGTPVEGFWVAVPDADIEKEMAKIPAMIKEYQVLGVERAARTSKATVSVTPEKGAPLRYVVTLSREGVGWKVSGIEHQLGATNE